MLIYASEGWLEAEDQEIIELHRSVKPVVVTAAGGEEFHLQATFCLHGPGSKPRAQVAFSCREIKRALIFTVEGASAGAQLQQGRESLEGLGFVMEPVNLKLSPAMLQVVLHDIPGLVNPRQARTQQAEKQAQMAELQAAVEEDPQGDAGKKAKRRLNVEGRLNEKAVVLRRHLIEQLATDAAGHVDGQALIKLNQELIDRLADAEAAQARERIGYERTAGILAAAEKRIQELEVTLVKVETKSAEALKDKQEILKLESRIEVLSGDLHAAQETLAEHQAEKIQFAEELKATHARAATAENQISRLQADLEEVVSQLDQEKLISHEREAERQVAVSRIKQLEITVQKADAGLQCNRELAERLKVADARISELEKEHEVSLAHAAEARLAHEELAERLAAAAEEMAVLEKDLANAEKKAGLAGQHEARLAEQGSQLEVLENALQVTQAEIDQVRRERKRFEDEAVADKNRINELENTLAEADKEGPGISTVSGASSPGEDLLRLQADLDKAMRAFEAEAESRREVENDLDQAHQMIDALEKALRDSTQNAEQSAAARYAAIGNRQIEELSAKLKRAESQLEQERGDREKHTSVVCEAERRIAELENALRQALDNAGQPVPVSGLPATKPEKPATPSRPLPHELKPAPPKGALFHPDWDLAGLPCKSAEQVVQAWESLFNVQLSLEGYPSQYCTAFLVVVDQGEGKQLYMLFRLKKNQHTLVCVPADPPADDAAMQAAIKAGQQYLRLSGFELEEMATASVVEMLGPFFLDD